MKRQSNLEEYSVNNIPIPYNTFDYNSRPDFDVDYIFNAIKQENKQQILRVAAYIRVSTDMQDQENSYIAQERYFRGLITSNSNWEYVGIYSDYGISGTGTADRIGFIRLIRHCKEGKIDRILCKSISRFARNIADFSRTLLLLREWHVTIFFEKENLDSADPKNEFLLSMLGAYAQEESRSISSNIRLGQTMHRQQGNVPNVAIYGYRFTGNWLHTEDGYRYREIEAVEEEARVVQLIFEKVAEGGKFSDISRYLNAQRIPAPVSNYKKQRMNGAKKGQLHSNLDDGWNSGRISQIVRSERYVGDVLTQKHYTPDYLTHEVKVNKGEVQQYYIPDHHPAIISRELYKQAQIVLDSRKKEWTGRIIRPKSPFAKRLICGECGRFLVMSRKTGQGIWDCPTAINYTAIHVCFAESVSEQQIALAISESIYKQYELQYSEIRRKPRVKPSKRQQKEEHTRKKLYGLFQDIIGRLEKTLNDDYVERTRSEYKCQLAELEDRLNAETFELERMEHRITNIQKFGSLIERRSLGEKLIELNAFRREVNRKKEEYESLTTKLNELEKYWLELEDDYELRAEALQWIKDLPRGKKGFKELLKGIAEKYFRAFILDITINPQKQYVLRWFDNTRTNVSLKKDVKE